MDDLLKEAIADAKAVRETALANAKMALEEAFTPRLKSMLAQKIQHEVEDEEKDKDEIAYEVEDEEEVYDKEEGEHEDAEEVHHEEEEMEDEEEGMHEEEDEEEEAEEVHDESKVIEIDGVKYAPVVAEEEEEEEEEEEMEEAEEVEEADELDLESILKELEEEEDEDEDKEEMDENDVSSGIGKSDNAHNKEAGDSSKVGQGPEGEGSSKEAGKELGDHEVVKESEEVEEGEDKEEGEDEMDEDIDLEEVLKALSEEETVEEEVDETATLKQEIKEHRDVVKYLRAKLNEVNLLNAKLLFSNKLFRTFGLTNEQKMKVVETFDRTKNLREIKLVYSTLAESFGQRKPSAVNESKRKGSSSKAVASTKPNKKVISEGEDLKARFKKLANII